MLYFLLCAGQKFGFTLNLCAKLSAAFEDVANFLECFFIGFFKLLRDMLVCYVLVKSSVSLLTCA